MDFTNTKFNTNQLVLVITCLGGQFGIKCPSAFWKLPKWNEGNFKISKNVGVIYFKNCPNKT